MSTHRKLIFALPANLFAGLLLLLAACLATSSQTRSQSNEERSEWDRSRHKRSRNFLLQGPTSDRGVGDRFAYGLSGHGARTTGSLLSGGKADIELHTAQS